MKVTPSPVSGIALIGPDEPGFRSALLTTATAVSLEALEPAIPFSIIVTNHSAQPVVLFAVRFDMLDGKGKPCSVVHYADTLRNPEKAGFPIGACRFVCAEASFTSLAIDGREPPPPRTRLTLTNLQRMRQIRASLDCVAFTDGQFTGPDSLGAFDRLRQERVAELEFIQQVLDLAPQPARAMESVMKIAGDGDRVTRRHARHLLEAFAAGGFEALLARARGHRHRIELHR